MRQYIYLANILAVTLAWAACKPGSNQPENSPVVQSDAAKPELFLYVATVDKLRLREKPDQSGAVLTEMKEGALVESAGNTSTHMEEIELRGIPYRAPYFQLTGGGKNNPIGWAFGGGLRCIYAGTRAGAPDTVKLSAFSSFLCTLDPKTVESSGRAWEYVETQFSGATGPLADAVFFLLEHFLGRLESEGEFYTITENIPFTASEIQAVDDGKFDAQKYPETAMLEANKFRLLTGEGAVFPAPDWRQLQDFFGPKVTHTLQKFINQRTAEQNNPMFDDGGIIIPLEYVADVAVVWEKFNRTDPYFPLGEETRESERWLRLMLVTGADNTPAFDSETQGVTPEFRAMWEHVQKKHAKTGLAKQIRKMMDVCAAEGWKRTKKVEEYQASLQRQ